MKEACTGRASLLTCTRPTRPRAQGQSGFAAPDGQFVPFSEKIIASPGPFACSRFHNPQKQLFAEVMKQLVISIHSAKE